jgi:transcriptional regulator with XRE-family HTH domain
LRRLAKEAGVAVSYLSSLESGRVSPTIASLRKILAPLNADLSGFFFSTSDTAPHDYVFRAEDMKSLEFKHSYATYLLPRRPDILIEMSDELLMPGVVPDFDRLPADHSGYVLDGDFILEFEGEEPRQLRPGDAYYVPGGQCVRGYCARSKPVRLVVVYYTGSLERSAETSADSDQESSPSVESAE